MQKIGEPMYVYEAHYYQRVLDPDDEPDPDYTLWIAAPTWDVALKTAVDYTRINRVGNLRVLNESWREIVIVTK